MIGGGVPRLSAKRAIGGNGPMLGVWLGVWTVWVSKAMEFYLTGLLLFYLFTPLIAETLRAVVQ